MFLQGVYHIVANYIKLMTSWLSLLFIVLSVKIITINKQVTHGELSQINQSINPVECDLMPWKLII